jgi:hypothetical protein
MDKFVFLLLTKNKCHSKRGKRGCRQAAATAVPLKMRRLSERSEESPAKWHGLH